MSLSLWRATGCAGRRWIRSLFPRFSRACGIRCASSTCRPKSPRRCSTRRRRSAGSWLQERAPGPRASKSTQAKRQPGETTVWKQKIGDVPEHRHRLVARQLTPADRGFCNESPPAGLSCVRSVRSWTKRTPTLLIDTEDAACRASLALREPAGQRPLLGSIFNGGKQGNFTPYFGPVSMSLLVLLIQCGTLFLDRAGNTANVR